MRQPVPNSHFNTGHVGFAKQVEGGRFGCFLATIGIDISLPISLRLPRRQHNVPCTTPLAPCSLRHVAGATYIAPRRLQRVACTTLPTPHRLHHVACAKKVAPRSLHRTAGAT
eukprot:3445057-Pyramimonas_sp.AAC.1